MSIYARRRTSLRQSLSKVLSRKSVVRYPIDRLKGRYLFRAAVRLVFEYFDWITVEPTVEEESDDVAVNVRIAEQKRVEKKTLTLQDRSILLTHRRQRRTADRMHILELFKKMRAFRKFADDIRKSLTEVVLYRYFPAGRVIIRQGHKAENLYFIASGEVKLTRIVVDKLTGDKKEIDAGTMNAGDTFGEVALLHYLPRTATVVSQTAVDLFLIPAEDFDARLRYTLLEEWEVLQDAMVHFNYFNSWNQETVRECCILGRIKDFRPDEVLLGDGKGMINYVHFLLEGECRLIEHMQVRERISSNKIRYELYDPDEKRMIFEKGRKRMRKFEMSEDVLHNLESKASQLDSSKTIEAQESVVNYTQFLLSSQPTDKRVDVERMSIVTTTLQDVVNQWHEITDVAAMLMREPSSISQQQYPDDVHTIFMQICMFHRGACFGLGENMINRRIVSITPVRCFLIPRYWLLEHNRANIWERVKLFMDSKYPTRKQLFKEFVKDRRWMTHKKNLVNHIIKKGRSVRSNTTMHDVPYSIRIANEKHLKM